jgi:hypothetical protein
MRAWISTRIRQTKIDRARLLDPVGSLLGVRQSINWYS